jgi:hypothetical protein
MGLLSPRIQEVTVEIAPSVPHELRLVLQRIADRFVDLRTALQKASHSRVLGAIMQVRFWRRVCSLSDCINACSGAPLLRARR